MAEVINADKFKEEVLKSDLPVVVDFFATWCMPCKMIAPSLEEITNEMQGKVKVFKVDIDESNALAASYNVRSVPTLIFFNKGEVADKVVGAIPKNAIMEKITNML